MEKRPTRERRNYKLFAELNLKNIMKQEIKVTITLEVDVTETKKNVIEMLNFKLNNLVNVDFIQNPSQIYNEENFSFQINWSVKDFEYAAKNNFLELQRDNIKEYEHFSSWEQIYDKSQFEKQLIEMIKNHDANEGINWHTVDEYLGKCEFKF